jgi:hypothetical protein
MKFPQDKFDTLGLILFLCKLLSPLMRRVTGNYMVGREPWKAPVRPKEGPKPGSTAINNRLNQLELIYKSRAVALLFL